MSEFRKLLESIPHSYDNFVEFCIEEFGQDSERRNKLIGYIKSKNHDNPADIIEFATMNLMDKIDED